MKRLITQFLDAQLVVAGCGEADLQRLFNLVAYLISISRLSLSTSLLQTQRELFSLTRVP